MNKVLILSTCIIVFLFSSCSATRIEKNYTAVRGLHNAVLTDEIRLHTSINSNIEKSNMFFDVYGNSYNYQIFFTFKDDAVYDNIEKLKFTEIVLFYQDVNINLLDWDNFVIRFPYPGAENTVIMDIFKEKKEIPFDISGKGFDYGIEIGIFFNNILIQYDKTETFNVKYEIEVVNRNVFTNKYKFMLFYEQEYKELKIYRWSA